MKAFTSSCSRTIFERLSDSRRGIINVANQPKICLSFGSREDKVSNFGFLQLTSAQHKGLPPVHVLPSETQADLDLVEDPPAQQTTKLVHVKFQMQKQCKFGEQFHIVGDDPAFGLWNPSDALPMTWSDGHVWTAELYVPVEKSIQFKFILKEATGTIVWQSGSDRVIQTWKGMNRITVCEDWENADLQKIIEEEPFAHSEKKLASDEEQEPDEEEDNVYNIPPSTKEPLAIVAENISSSNDVSMNARDGIDLGSDGKAAPVKNEIGAVPQDNLFDFEGGPVLVPGLTSSVMPSGETAPKKDDETIMSDTSVEASENRDQNLPEFEEKHDSDDIPREINAELHDDQELLDDKFKEESYLATMEEEFSDSFHLVKREEMSDSLDSDTMEEMADFQSIDGNVMKNDIQWGRETLKKFLTKFGLL